MDNTTKKIKEYIYRVVRQARVADEALQTSESSARSHQASTISAVLEKIMNEPTTFKVQLMNENAKVPQKAHASDAGWDLFASESTYIYPGSTVVVKTGVKIELLEGWEAQVRSRSGLSIYGLTVANSPGTIDAGYRGEIAVILTNTSPSVKTVIRGDKIAQLVFQKVENVSLTVVEEVDTKTERSDAGFGSTDKKESK